MGGIASRIGLYVAHDFLKAEKALDSSVEFPNCIDCVDNLIGNRKLEHCSRLFTSPQVREARDYCEMSETEYSNCDVVLNFPLSALTNARFDSVNHRAEQLKTELANIKTELDSKNAQITAITTRLEALENQMETKNDQICIILLFLVLYLAVCATPLFEGLHAK